MIEILFNYSACGSLKHALIFSKTKRATRSIGVVLSRHDGSSPSDKEIKQAQKHAEEQDRLEWKNAVPIKGNAKDVFGFNLMLDIGDISEKNFISNRAKTIESLWSIYPGFSDDEPINLAKDIRKEIANVHKRITSEDEVRIWYSNQPNEMCCLYWFMNELTKLQSQPKAVYVVKLPEYEHKNNDTIVTHLSWGEISSSQWHKYTAYTEETTDVFRRYCVHSWKMLQLENSPLRVVLNGKIHSVSESIYDEFIYREIENQEDEFSEAVLIGTILGKYQLGIGDDLLANRIEHIIKDGCLEVASEHKKDSPVYHRKLRKIK